MVSLASGTLAFWSILAYLGVPVWTFFGVLAGIPINVLLAWRWMTEGTIRSFFSVLALVMPEEVTHTLRF